MKQSMNKSLEAVQLAANYINNTNCHVFLTGKAGTGKTTFLHHIKENTYKNVVVAAPTGIAAINAGGVTLHSLLQLPFGAFVPDIQSFHSHNAPFNTPATLNQGFRINSTKKELIRKLDLLIIDEVSMLRADLLDCIDQRLRFIRRNQAPFGGIQLLLIGDLLQLPPVVKDYEQEVLSAYYDHLFFFESKALKKSSLIRVELDKVYRQQDNQFIGLLNRLRNNKQTKDDIDFLNQHHLPPDELVEQEGYIFLTTHNYKADQVNKRALARLEGEVSTFEPEIKGEFPENMFPIGSLTLKIGAQVMFIKNDPTGDERFFNGKIGKITAIEEGILTVETEDGDMIDTGTFTWENKRFTLNNETNEIEEKTLGTFEHYPIRLAWAITIHKSQGLTFEKAILDLESTFAPGQLYVALSRLTSLNGLILASPIPSKAPEIESALSTIESGSSFMELEKRLDDHQKDYILSFSEQVFSFDLLKKEFHFHLKSFKTEDSKSPRQPYLVWTRKQDELVSDLQQTGASFVKQIRGILSKSDYLEMLSVRMTKAYHYFDPLLEKIFMELQEHAGSIKKKSNTKAYHKELMELIKISGTQRKDLARLFLFVNSLKEAGTLTQSDLWDMPAYQVDFKPKKKPKKPTAEITYELYQKGKTIEEIAEERGFVPETILGHLAQYVANGILSINDFVEDKKIDVVKKAFESGYQTIGDLKRVLGDDISYGEIKIVLAELEVTKPE